MLRIKVSTSLFKEPAEFWFWLLWLKAINVSITVNGQPIFLEGIAVFNVVNRGSSAYTVQASLMAGDIVGASAASDSPIASYANRSLTIIQLS